MNPARRQLRAEVHDGDQLADTTATATIRSDTTMRMTIRLGADHCGSV